MAKIYISGPMSGYKDNNFEAFQEAEEKLSKNYPDYKFINPHKLAKDFMQAHPDFLKDEKALYEKLLALDLKIVSEDANAMVLLPGWQDSHGCIEEIKTAIEYGLGIFHYVDGRVCDDQKGTVIR